VGRKRKKERKIEEKEKDRKRNKTRRERKEKEGGWERERERERSAMLSKNIYAGFAASHALGRPSTPCVVSIFFKIYLLVLVRHVRDLVFLCFFLAFYFFLSSLGFEDPT